MEFGTIWKCECGRYWRVEFRDATFPRWFQIPALVAWFARRWTT